MKRNIVSLLLSSALMFSITAVSSADSIPQDNSPIEVPKTILVPDQILPPTSGDGTIITPMASSKPFNINFNGDRTSDYAVFTTSSAMPWAKVHAYNSGNGNMRVTITKDSPSGQVMGAFTLSPGQQDSIKGMMSTPGTYYVSFVSTTAYLKGSASCRIASTYEELDV